MLIGILQTGASPDLLRPTYGDYPDMFETLLANQGFEFRRYAVMDMEFPASVNECQGWLVTGSRFGAYEDHPFIAPLEAFIRDAYAHKVPMVGICFGHQIIAQAMGGKVEKYQGGWSVGPTDYQFDGQTVTLNAWHQDQVVEKPEAAQCLGSSGFCENAALLYDDRIFTVQAHPEFNSTFIKDMMATRGPGIVPQDRLDNANAKLDKALSTDVFVTYISDFFKRAQ